MMPRQPQHVDLASAVHRAEVSHDVRGSREGSHERVSVGIRVSWVRPPQHQARKLDEEVHPRLRDNALPGGGMTRVPHADVLIHLREPFPGGRRLGDTAGREQAMVDRGLDEADADVMVEGELGLVDLGTFYRKDPDLFIRYQRGELRISFVHP